MDNKRLSLSSLTDQIDSLKGAEWPTMKRYFRRQIVKCINECKTQACNAKKLVDNIKDHSKNKTTEHTGDDEDDVGWGSDFDDEDESDENEDSAHQSANIKAKQCIFDYNLKQSCEDLDYQPVGGYISNGSFRSLDDNQLQITNNCGHSSECRHNINDTKVFDRLIDRTISENSILVKTELENRSTLYQSCANGLNLKPKPCPRVMPKPPSTKPEVPKNKPQIIPRKPFINYATKPTINSSAKRPPLDPPPPPLPQSPPPASPSVIPTDLDAVFSETLSFLTEYLTNDEENYESIVPMVLPLLTEDEYLAPNAPIIMDRKRKNSSSTISSQSTGYSQRDGESPIGNLRSLSSQTLNQSSINVFDCDYQPFIGSKQNDPSFSVSQNVELDYEVVNENQTNQVLNNSQRPHLPKVKDVPIGNSKSKRIAEVLQNWNKNPKEKKNIRDKNDFDHSLEDNASLSLTPEPINNNNSLGILTRPLPPLPRLPSPLPSLHPLPPLSESHSFTSNESLRNFDWFHEVEREDAEALLMTQDEDGAYLVRESKRAGKSNPFTLTIYHNGRVFHLNIRKRPDGYYALGKEKSREKTFKTVDDLISYHKMEAILLTTRGTPAGKTRLITTPYSS